MNLSRISNGGTVVIAYWYRSMGIRYRFVFRLYTAHLIIGWLLLGIVFLLNK